MAVGGNDPNVIGPIVSNITVGTSAVRVKSSSTIAMKFTLVAPAGNRMFVGDSSVSSTKCIPLPAGSSATFGPEQFHGTKSVSYDLARFWLLCSSAAQTASVVIYSKEPNLGPF